MQWRVLVLLGLIPGALPVMSFVGLAPVHQAASGGNICIGRTVVPQLPKEWRGRAWLTTLVASPQDGGQDSAGADGRKDFYDKAEQLLETVGGQLDSLAFGRRWSQAYPGEDLEAQKSGGVGAIQMLAESSRFRVQQREGSSVATVSLAAVDAASPPSLAPPPSYSAPSTPSTAAPPASVSASSKKTGASAVAASDKGIEQRESTRGYSFSVVKAPKQGSDAQSAASSSPPPPFAPNPPASSGSSTEGLRRRVGSDQPVGATGGGGGGVGEKGGGGGKGREVGGGASKLIDVWSQAAALSNSDDLQQQVLAYVFVCLFDLQQQVLATGAFRRMWPHPTLPKTHMEISMFL